MQRPSSRFESERGAVLIHVAMAMLVLIGFLTFVVDHGVMWVARAQAQNAADAGALAGAVAMAFDANGWTDRSDTGPGKQSARQMAISHSVMGAIPVVNMATDVYFTGQPADMCPADATATPRAFAWTCIATRRATTRCRRSSVRPSGSRRTASARRRRLASPSPIPALHEAVYYPGQVGRQLRHVTENPGNIPPVFFPEDDQFELHDSPNQNGGPLANPDVYVRPTSTSPGSGFTVAADLDARHAQAGGASDRHLSGCSIQSGYRDMTGTARAPTTFGQWLRAQDCRSASGTWSRVRTET